MDKKIKKSVAALFAHIIKADQRDIEKEAPLFCQLMGEDFSCDKEEAQRYLKEIRITSYNVCYTKLLRT